MLEANYISKAFAFSMKKIWEYTMKFRSAEKNVKKNKNYGLCLIYICLKLDNYQLAVKFGVGGTPMS